MEIQDRVVIVTGAGQGLGQMIAVNLAEQGAQLALIDVNESALRITQDQCHLLNSKAMIYTADVSNEKEVEEAFQHIVEDFGHIDVLINNAGIINDGLLVCKRDGVIRKMPLSQYQKVMDINATGSFLCGREAAAHMIEHDTHGVIINISSVARAGNVGQTNYSASKAAVAAMTVTWAKELARYQIRVAAVAPGVIDTPMIEQMKQEALERLEKSVPAGRVGNAEEVGHALKFILENDYFTGRILEIDGGLRI
ncbi:SDR family oxidoreductase [Photobacterium damselae]